uniref:Secreted protein n=1 Tax=Eutreptiella gymnastica TaxID=73025 RepID=A0A7S4G903_9EUGL
MPGWVGWCYISVLWVQMHPHSAQYFVFTVCTVDSSESLCRTLMAQSGARCLAAPVALLFPISICFAHDVSDGAVGCTVPLLHLLHCFPFLFAVSMMFFDIQLCTVCS